MWPVSTNYQKYQRTNLNYQKPNTWYMMWPVSTRVPGVKVQVWNSCRDKIPGNFFRRYFFNSEISTLPGNKSS